MAKDVVTIKGFDELKAKFAELKHAARGPALMTAAKAGILPIQNRAIDNAPYVSGNLSRSIHTEEVATGAYSAQVTTGTDVEYARRVEKGFDGVDALGREYHQPAQPYMRPAYDEGREEASEEVTESLKTIVLAAAS